MSSSESREVSDAQMIVTIRLKYYGQFVDRSCVCGPTVH